MSFAKHFKGVIDHHEGMGIDVEDHFLQFSQFSERDDAEDHFLLFARVASGTMKEGHSTIEAGEDVFSYGLRAV